MAKRTPAQIRATKKMLAANKRRIADIRRKKRGKKATRKTTKKATRRTTKKTTRKRAPSGGDQIKVDHFGTPEVLIYRKGGRKYSHPFGKRARLYVTGDRRYLVVGPISVRNGQIHG